jgi:hypothetical protein
MMTASLIAIHVDRALAFHGFAHLDRAEVERRAIEHLKARNQMTLATAVSEAIASIIDERGPLAKANGTVGSLGTVGDGASEGTPSGGTDHEVGVSAADPAVPAETCAEHLRNALTILNCAGHTVPGGQFLRVVDVASLRWRISTAIEQSEREGIAQRASRKNLDHAMAEVRRLRVGTPDDAAVVAVHA